MKKYIDILNPSERVNAIRIELYYSLGGINYFTYQNESRGYYLLVTPVYKNGIMESVTAFTGVKQCIKQVNRKSAKAEKDALQIAPGVLPDMIDHVCMKNGIQISTLDIMNIFQ